MRRSAVTSTTKRRMNLVLCLGAGCCFLTFICLVTLPKPASVLLTFCVIAMLLGFAFFYIWDGVISIKHVIKVLLFVSILFPFIRLPGGIPDVRLEYIIAILAWGLLFLNYFVKANPVRLRLLPSYKWFALFGFLIMLSTIYAALFMRLPLILRDFWEFVKLCLYFLIFVLVANQNIDSKELKRYYMFVLFILVISSSVGFLQYINFAGINEVVSPYYAPTQMRGLLVHGRITGTTPNPNEFGALMVLASSLALSGAMFFREWKQQLLCWLALLIYAMALILTLSRTSLVSLLVAGAAVIFFFFKRKDFKYKLRLLFTFFLLGSVIAFLILQVIPEKGFTRYGEIKTFTESSSYKGRIERWEASYAIWIESPLLGWGPGKATMSTIVDNEWLFILRRYGAIGLLAFLCLCWSLFSGLSRIRKNSIDPSVVALTVSLQSTFIGYIIYMALANVYNSLQLMPILILLLGLAYTQWKPGQQ